MNQAVFFDRDGTLMEDVHYCAYPGLVKLFADVPAALRRLKDAGFRNFIITNQSGIGRGLLTESQYHAVHDELLRQIGPSLIDATYYCPDAPSMPSVRRKPQPGMVFEAAAQHHIDLARSFFIGDKSADIECGRRAGVRTILVSTGYGTRQVCEPDFRAANLVEAVEYVLLP